MDNNIHCEKIKDKDGNIGHSSEININNVYIDRKDSNYPYLKNDTLYFSFNKSTNLQIPSESQSTLAINSSMQSVNPYNNNMSNTTLINSNKSQNENTLNSSSHLIVPSTSAMKFNVARFNKNNNNQNEFISVTTSTAQPLILSKMSDVGMKEEKKRLKLEEYRRYKNINYNQNSINKAFTLNKSMKTSWDSSSSHVTHSSYSPISPLSPVSPRSSFSNGNSNFSTHSHSHSHSHSKFKKRNSNITTQKISHKNKKKSKSKKNQKLHTSPENYNEFEMVMNNSKLSERKRGTMVITTNNDEEFIKRTLDRSDKTNYSRHLSSFSIGGNVNNKEDNNKNKTDNNNSNNNNNIEVEIYYEENKKNNEKNQFINFNEDDQIYFKNVLDTEKPEQLKPLLRNKEKNNAASLLLPPRVMYAEDYNNTYNKYYNEFYDASLTKNLGNDSVIIANSRINNSISSNRYRISQDDPKDSSVANDINRSDNDIDQLTNNNEIVHENSFNKNNLERPMNSNLSKRSYSLNIKENIRNDIKRSNSNYLENYTSCYEFEEAQGTKMNICRSSSGYFSNNSKISLPQRYQRGQLSEKNLPVYTLSRNSRMSYSSSTTSQFINRPRIVSGTTYGSDYNPDNTTYSISDIDFNSWGESISTVYTSTNANPVTILQDIHDEVFLLLKGTHDDPIPKKTIRKHFFSQYGPSILDSYGDFINECVSEFYQDNNSRYQDNNSRYSRHLSNGFSIKHNSVASSNNRYGNVLTPLRTSVINSESQQTSSDQNHQSFSQQSYQF